jgi:hypothetical protein
VNFVTPVDLDTLPAARRARLALEVLVTYVRVRWVMRDGDAQHAVRQLRCDAGYPARKLENDLELLAAWRLARIVSRVLNPLPSDSRCLFRSLTLMCMLERRGIAQTLVIAVRPNPFAAHAWIEVGARPMLPDADPGFERLLEL